MPASEPVPEAPADAVTETRPRAAVTVTAAQRRARLARRQGLVEPFADVDAASRALVGLHGTDAAGPYLAAWARVPDFTTSALDDAFVERRTLVRHLAMRRTLWVVGAELLPQVVAVAGQRVAGVERRRLVKELTIDGGFGDADAWLDTAAEQIRTLLADGRPRTSGELRAELPEADRTVVNAPGTRWGQAVPVLPRVLTWLSAAGLVVRGPNRLAWTASRPGWTTPEAWWGAPVAVADERAARAALVARWLRAFGPGTERDIVWWFGSTLTAVRQALADVDAVPVRLVPDAAAPTGGAPGGEVGYLLPDDLEPVAEPGSWVAVLPALDPTTMGWAGREWYLGAHASEVVDSVGNAGPTIWVDGRVVGAWAATRGTVEVALLEDVGRAARAAVDDEVARLTGWLAGGRVTPTFPSPLFGGRRARPAPAGTSPG